MLRRKEKFLLEVKNIIDKHGGILLNKNVNSKIPIHFMCANNHECKMTIKVLRNNKWCKRCWIDDKIKNIIGNKGECLHIGPYPYLNSSIKLPWKCNHGHIWHTTLKQILYKKSWCPLCYQINRKKS
jgi:hypothetical protein